MAVEQNCNSSTTEVGSSHHILNIEFLNHERLNYEEERIKTFASWPVHLPVDPSRLAKAGFYYTGIADEVVCFSCQGHIKNWNYGDIVLKKHNHLFPNCDFIKNRSNNVPLLKTSIKSNQQPLIIENINKNIKCAESVIIDYNKMKVQRERLKTFTEKWPLSFINTLDLAHAGFFYTGIDCKVQCAYCKGIISNWEVGSVPIKEHLKQFPWCDYVLENIAQIKKEQSSSQDVCGNMVMQTTSSHNYSQPSFERIVIGSVQKTDLEDLGVHLYRGPVHPHQASLSARLRSFETWPSDAPVSKEELATAGFFYLGLGDRTICFHCNGGLCTWEKGDDPWVEHARWFSTCDFLHLNKGSDFIKSCAVKNLQMVKEKKSNESSGLDTKAPVLKKVDEAMKSNLVKYVLETELFPLYIVRAALLLQIKQTGEVFTNIEDLCVAASSLKEEMENQTFDVEPVQADNLNINERFSKSCSVSNLPSVSSNTCVTPVTPTDSTFKKDFQIENSEKSKSLEEDDLNEPTICKICMDRKVGVVFLPCGHLHACTVCAAALRHCPMCRKAIQATVRVYLD